MTGPGRNCPLHYRYAPAVFNTAPPARLQDLEVLYVVGGLYGNDLALQSVLRLFERESGRARLVFNGDFHWFDAEPTWFERVQREVLAFDVLRGNVETELAAPEDAAGAGCGCAYPDWVGDVVVERSNRIVQRLRGAATAAQRAELAALPMWLRASVGAVQIGIVHGDACSLAGWGFAQEHLADAAHRQQVQRWFDAAQVEAFASSHTCLPVFQRIGGAAAPRWVLNNGAAGMPNFRGDGAGLLTRFALRPFDGQQRRFGVQLRGLFIDAIAIETDAVTWQRRFQALWPGGSDAFASYFERIVDGPAYAQGQCVRA
jgi:hypothetical protein